MYISNEEPRSVIDTEEISDVKIGMELLVLVKNDYVVFIFLSALRKL